MSVDMFSTRKMLQMLEEQKPAAQFLKKTFFANMQTFMSEYVDIDIMKKKRRMAAFVSERIGGTTVERTGYTTNSYKPLLVAPDMITTAEDLLKRSPGESMYAQKSPVQRAAEMLGRDMAELDNMIARREEWMCAQALFTGMIPMVGEGVSQTLDFGFDAGHKVTLTGADKWDQATCDIYDDLKTWRQKIVDDSGVAPTMAILGSTAAEKFLSDEKIAAKMDMLRYNIGTVNINAMGGGVTEIGRLPGLGLTLYTYDESYVDDAGAAHVIVPIDKVLLGSPEVRTDMLYGAIVDVNRGTFETARFPKSWTQEKPSARFVQLMCRPLPVPTQVDGFLFATVV